MKVLEYPHHGGISPETAALRNILIYHDVRAPHSGEPYSEELLLGIGGGIGMGYWIFEIGDHPFLLLGSRHLWENPGAFLQGICKRLEIPLRTEETSGRNRADARLRKVLGAGTPALAAVDPAALPYLDLPAEWSRRFIHTVGVRGLTETSALLDDRAGTPLQVTPGELAAARGAIAAVRHRLLVPSRPARSPDLPAAIHAGIRACWQRLLDPPLPNLGLRALERWTELIHDPAHRRGWPQVFAAPGALHEALAALFRYVELWGGDGGSFRAMYARYLDEAGEVLQESAFRAAAAAYREATERWRALAAAALPDGVPALGETRELLTRSHRCFTERGMESLPERRAIHARLAVLQAEATEGRLPDLETSRALLDELHQKLAAVHAAELAAAGALRELVP